MNGYRSFQRTVNFANVASLRERRGSEVSKDFVPHHSFIVTGKLHVSQSVARPISRPLGGFQITASRAGAVAQHAVKTIGGFVPPL